MSHSSFRFSVTEYNSFFDALQVLHEEAIWPLNEAGAPTDGDLYAVMGRVNALGSNALFAYAAASRIQNDEGRVALLPHAAAYLSLSANQAIGSGDIQDPEAAGSLIQGFSKSFKLPSMSEPHRMGLFARADYLGRELLVGVDPSYDNYYGVDGVKQALRCLCTGDGNAQLYLARGAGDLKKLSISKILGNIFPEVKDGVVKMILRTFKQLEELDLSGCVELTVCTLQDGHQSLTTLHLWRTSLSVELPHEKFPKLSTVIYQPTQQACITF